MNAPRFHYVAAPTQAELQRLLRAIATRTTRALERQGVLSCDEENPSLDIEPDNNRTETPATMAIDA